MSLVASFSFSRRVAFRSFTCLWVVHPHCLYFHSILYLALFEYYMPEPPEVNGFAKRMQRLNAFLKKKSGHEPQCESSECQSEGLLTFLLGSFQILPRCFATGTPQKPYTTCTVNTSGYSETTEPRDPGYIPDYWDQLRSSGEPWEYLLKSTTPGELHCEVRGKQMVIISGHVRFSIGFQCNSKC